MPLHTGTRIFVGSSTHQNYTLFLIVDVEDNNLGLLGLEQLLIIYASTAFLAFVVYFTVKVTCLLRLWYLGWLGLCRLCRLALNMHLVVTTILSDGIQHKFRLLLRTIHSSDCFVFSLSFQLPRDMA